MPVPGILIEASLRDTLYLYLYPVLLRGFKLEGKLARHDENSDSDNDDDGPLIAVALTR